MRGITRPCRHTLTPELRERWRSHLCGLCLTLRGEAGQASRLFTGYDMLVPAVLVEAQMGRAQTTTAGRCPLRGMRTASVLPSEHPGVRFAAGASLLNGAAGLEDKAMDGDVPRWSSRAVGRAAEVAAREGRRLTDESGFEAKPFAGAARAAADAEGTGATLDEFLAPAGRAGAALFAHTAALAGCPQNEEALRRVGDAFGRLVHLIDAVEDYGQDVRAGAFNPLAVTRTSVETAREEARRLAADVRNALDDVEMVDPELARALLGPVVERAAERPFHHTDRAASAVTLAVALPAVMAGIFGGGRGWRRRPPGPYGYDPYYGQGPYGRGYRRGPGCCDLLACDCCANMACNDCCGGGDDDCCCLCC